MFDVHVLRVASLVLGLIGSLLLSYDLLEQPGRPGLLRPFIVGIIGGLFGGLYEVALATLASPSTVAQIEASAYAHYIRTGIPIFDNLTVWLIPISKALDIVPLFTSAPIGTVAAFAIAFLFTNSEMRGYSEVLGEHNIDPHFAPDTNKPSGDLETTDVPKSSEPHSLQPTKTTEWGLSVSRGVQRILARVSSSRVGHALIITMRWLGILLGVSFGIVLFAVSFYTGLMFFPGTVFAFSHYPVYTLASLIGLPVAAFIVALIAMFVIRLQGRQLGAIGVLMIVLAYATQLALELFAG